MHTDTQNFTPRDLHDLTVFIAVDDARVATLASAFEEAGRTRAENGQAVLDGLQTANHMREARGLLPIACTEGGAA